ncbi:MAG: iron ABC transporter permease [Treponema sp.]|nr:iron ABC transporter permease [Treponema sp.]
MRGAGLPRTVFGGLFALLLTGLALSIGVSVSMGQVAVPLSDTFAILANKLFGFSGGESYQTYINVIWLIRFPRALLACVTGAGLAMCGTAMQAAVQNPLADPYILGVSSGASLGATFAILIGWGASGILARTGVAFWAFLGAFGASMLVMAIAGMGGKPSSVKLILAGVIINALCGAITNFIVYTANDAQGIRNVAFWSMGSLASANWKALPLVTVVTVLSAAFFLTQTRILNTMLLGDEAAITLGVNLTLYRRLYLLVTALATGLLVSSCGMIGFVGLIVPHIVRGVVGSDHKRLLPLAILCGALFLVWADIVARTSVRGSELPIGIVTALAGAPLFMYMVVWRGYGFGGR